MDDKELEKGISLLDILQILKKNIILIAVTTVIITAVGIVLAFMITPKYSSRASVMVQVSDNGSSDDSDVTTSLRIVTTVAEFIKSDLVTKAASTALENDPEQKIIISFDQIQEGLSMSYSTSSLNIEISFTSSNREYCDEVLDTLIERARYIANETKNEDDTPYYPVIADTISSVSTASEAKYVSPNKKLYAVISFVLGAVLGVAIAFVKELFNTTINSVEELENTYGLKVIGNIPDFAAKVDKKNV